jgi:hypothetical protein
LVINGEAQIAGVGTYCWSEPVGESERMAVCADMIGVPTAEDPLTVDGRFVARMILPLDSPPEMLMLETYRVGEADEIERRNGQRWWTPQLGERQELSLGRVAEFTLAPDPGLYVLSVFARWPEEGDVNYGFLVEVKR